MNTRISGSYGHLDAFRYLLPEKCRLLLYNKEISAFKNEWSKYPAYIDHNLPTFSADREKYWLLCK